MIYRKKQALSVFLAIILGTVSVGEMQLFVGVSAADNECVESKHQTYNYSSIMLGDLDDDGDRCKYRPD